MPAVTRAKKPKPIKKSYAVVVTRLHGEYDTKAEATEASNKIKLRKDEWSVVLSKEK